jgi:hypothetical protein
MTHLYLAQAGSNAAADMIQKAIAMSENTRQSWAETWEFVLAPDSLSLWGAIVKFSFGIAAFALIYLAIQYGSEIAKTKSMGTVIEMFIFPLTVLVLLGGDGRILSGLVFAIRGVAQTFMEGILATSLGGVTFQKAITELNQNNLAIARVRQLLSQCDGLVGAQLNECFDRASGEAQQIVDALTNQDELRVAQDFWNLVSVLITARTGVIGGVGANFLGSNALSLIDGGFAQVIQDRFLPLVQFVLYIVQWAVVNLIEAALLMTALFAPIAVAMSLLPLAGRPIFAWLSGFLGILAVQMGYNILVGLMAFVIVNIDDVTEAISGMGFLMFSAIFSPFLAYQIGRGGGVALYQGISNRAIFAVQAMSSLIAQATQTAVKMMR